MSISNGILSGHIASFKHIQEKSVHIFTPSNSGLELKPSEEFSINLNEVSKIEIKIKKEFNKANTDLAVILGVLGAGTIVVIICLLTFKLNFNMDLGL